MDIAMVAGIFALLFATSLVAWQLYRQRTTLADFTEATQANVDAIPQQFANTAARLLKEGLSPLLERTEKVVVRLEASATTVTDLNGSVNSNARQIASLTDVLKQTHQQFNSAVVTFDQALETLAEPGTVQAWLDALPGLANPLERVHRAIENSFAVNQSLVQKVQSILDEWAAQRGELERHSRSIADSVNNLAQDEILRRKNEEAQLLGQYELLAQQAERSATNLRELQTVVGELANRIELTQDEIRAIADQGRQLIDSTAGQLEQIIREQRGSGNIFKESSQVLRETTNTIANYHTLLGATLAQLSERVNQIGVEAHKWQADIRQTTNEQLKTLSDVYQKTLHDFHSRHLEVMGNLEKRHQQMLTEQEALYEQVKQQLASFPTHRQQWLQTVVLVGLLILGVVALVLGQ